MGKGKQYSSQPWATSTERSRGEASRNGGGESIVDFHGPNEKNSLNVDILSGHEGFEVSPFQ